MACVSGALLLKVALAISLLPEGLPEKTELRILGLLPYYQGATGWDSGYLLNPAPSIAVDDINNNDTILSNYKLTMIVRNGGCEDAAVVATSVGEALLTDNIVGIIGAPCSFSTIIMSNIVNNAGINQISYGSELAAVSDTTEYPYFFRTTINLAHAADGFAALLGVFQRTSIIVIAQQIQTWEEVASFFEVKFRFYGNTTVRNTVAHEAFLSDSDDDGSMDAKLITISRLNRHAIVTFLPPNIATRLMCRAYLLGMTYPNYLWIHHLTTGEWEWWKDNAYFENLQCTADEMQRAHNGSLIHRLQLNATNETRYEEFIDHYELRLEQYLKGLNVPYIPPGGNCSNTSLPCVSSIVHGLYSRTAYDAVWVLATALDRAEKILNESYGLNLTSFQSGINDFSEVIQQALGETDFDGLSGEIEYKNESKTLPKNTRAIQSAFYLIRKSESEVVATFANANITTEEIARQLNMEVEEDADDIYGKLFSPPTGAVALMLNIVYLVLTTVLLVLNNMYFQHQPFKGSDATLTNFQIGFVYLLTFGSLVSSVFSCVDIDRPIVFGVAVNCSVWFAEVGLFTFLALAAAKSYRLYRLFIHFSEKPQYLNVKYLLVYILISLGVVTLIEIICASVTPYVRSSGRYFVFDIEFYHAAVALSQHLPHFFVITALILFLLVFLFALGIQSWMIRDPRFYDIHYHAMLSLLIFLYCIIAGATIIAQSHLYWPFLHAVLFTYCGLAIQFFFVLTFFWKFYSFHSAKGVIKCHCMPKSPKSKQCHHLHPATKSPIVYRRRVSSRVRNADYRQVSVSS